MSNPTEIRRLTLLRCLSEIDDRRSNSAVLHDCLRQLAVPGTRDDCDAELRWLQEQGLVVLKTLGSVLIADLLARGEEVALGERRVPGVARPRARG